MRFYPAYRCRTIMENAVQSLLQVPNLPSADLARALLLRAKVRLAAGYRTSAQQGRRIIGSSYKCRLSCSVDLHSVLTVDPENQDVKSLIQSQHLRPEMVSPELPESFVDIHPRCLQLLREPDCPPRFSIEVWREIALFLPRRDLKSLLLVPHALSRIASQLLFREIDLHLTASLEHGRVEERSRISYGETIDQDVDAWHYQRSADILTRILVDPLFSGQVRSLSVYAVAHDTSQPLAFQVGA